MSGFCEPPIVRVRWPKTYRIIASRFPPIQLFERLAPPGEWEALARVESLTNPRLRDLAGDIALIAPQERVSGPGASWVMAPFIYKKPSRFSDGQRGVYYAARSQVTAVAETSYHMGRFYASTSEPPLQADMRVLIGAVDAKLHDIRKPTSAWTALYAPDDYTASQAFGATLRAKGSRGIAYSSVRHAGGECLGGFTPRTVAPPIQGPHLLYAWNGTRVHRFFDYARETWVELT